MKVLVTGGTGFVGTRLCAELSSRGHDVTAMARNPESADFGDAAVRTVVGDVTAYDSVVDAFEGQDAVVNLVALSPLFRPEGGDHRHVEVHLGGTENVVEAAEEHDLERVVQMSGVHADPDADTSYLRAKGRAEEVVRDADLDWVIIRPTVLFGEGDELVNFVKLVTTPYVTGLPGGGRQRFQLLWVGDMAPMLADATEDDAHVGETYELGGPEVLTFKEVVERIYEAEGKSVMSVPVPLVLADVGLAVLGGLGGPLGSDQAKSLRKDLAIQDNDVDAFGVDVTSLKTFGEYLGV